MHYRNKFILSKNNVKQFIFSSSAAVYGEPLKTPIDEMHPCAPLNPYGRSKWMVEEIIKDYATSDGLKYAIFRYFNAAGADPEGKLGECHDPESHLIPIVLQVANGQRDHITIYGNDYPTQDGTCVRDYVHVADICDAHLLGLSALIQGKTALLYNLGMGVGYSVRQIIDAACEITKKPIPIILGKRRAGDSAILVADKTLVERELNWQPRYSDIKIILKHAWRFIEEKKHEYKNNRTDARNASD